MTQSGQSTPQMNAQTQPRNPCVPTPEEAGHSENGSKIEDVDMYTPVASTSDTAHKVNLKDQGTAHDVFRQMNPKVEGAISRFLESSHNDSGTAIAEERIQQVKNAIDEAAVLASDDTGHASRVTEDTTSALLHEFRIFLKRSEDNLEVMKEMKEHMVKLNEKQDAAYRLIQEIHAKVAGGQLLHNALPVGEESLFSDDSEYLV